MLSFRDYILNESKADKIIVYHGTSPKNFNSIMSQGLIPNPAKRSFDKHGDLAWSSTSIKSLEGIYVTTNLGTAILSAGIGSHKSMRDGKLIIIAEIQPKTGFIDEDKLRRFDQVADSEYVIANLYGALNSQPEQEFISQYYHRFKKRMYDMLAELKYPPHPNFMQRIDYLLWNLFKTAVKRQASYLDDWTFRKAKEYSSEITKPDKSQAENDLLQAKEDLTKTLKKMANPHNLSDESIFSSRIMTPIGFKGANKILSIVFEPPTKDPPEIWYGEVPPQFIKDWKSIIGDWKPKKYF